MQQIYNNNNNPGCFGKVHAKIFEIILIAGFICGTVFLTVNFVFTMFCFINLYYLFYIEIGLMVLNVISLVFSIILRVFRSNGSVLNKNYTSSHCISIILLFLIIINFFGSIVEDVLYFFIFSASIMESKNNTIKEFAEKITKNSGDKEVKSFFDDDKTTTILKYVPWICFNLNAVIQILALIVIIFLSKRIKHKSDYGISSSLLTQNMQPSSIQNPNATNKNSGMGLTNNKNKKKQNIFAGDETNVNKKKSKKKSKGKSPKKEPNSNPESDQIEIMDERRVKKKKGKKKGKKNKSKEIRKK